MSEYYNTEFHSMIVNAIVRTVFEFNKKNADRLILASFDCILQKDIHKCFQTTMMKAFQVDLPNVDAKFYLDIMRNLALQCEVAKEKIELISENNLTLLSTLHQLSLFRFFSIFIYIIGEVIEARVNDVTPRSYFSHKKFKQNLETVILTDLVKCSFNKNGDKRKPFITTPSMDFQQIEKLTESKIQHEYSNYYSKCLELPDEIFVMLFTHSLFETDFKFNTIQSGNYTVKSEDLINCGFINKVSNKVTMPIYSLRLAAKGRPTNNLYKLLFGFNLDHGPLVKDSNEYMDLITLILRLLHLKYISNNKEYFVIKDLLPWFDYDCDNARLKFKHFDTTQLANCNIARPEHWNTYLTDYTISLAAANESFSDSWIKLTFYDSNNQFYQFYLCVQSKFRSLTSKNSETRCYLAEEKKEDGRPTNVSIQDEYEKVEKRLRAISPMPNFLLIIICDMMCNYLDNAYRNNVLILSNTKEFARQFYGPILARTRDKLSYNL